MTEPASRSRRAAVFLARLLGLLTLAAVCGATANLVHPRRIAWVEDWSRYIEARALAAGIKLADTVEARDVNRAAAPIVATSDAVGQYRFVGLRPGVWEVYAKLQGFNPARVENINLRLGQVLTVDLALATGHAR